MATIELYGREVIPRVRELLAAAPRRTRRRPPASELTMAVAAIERPPDRRRRPEVDDLRLGIVGAGKFGTTLARAAVAAGYDVAISGSGPADEIALTVDVLAPGARAATTDEVVRHADVIVLAVPTHRFRELPPDLFAGKILIDAMNYWEPVDGDDPELTTAADGTSRSCRSASAPRGSSRASTNSATTSSKRTGAPKGAPDRIAIGAAGDDRLAVAGHAAPRPARVRPRRRRTAQERPRAGTRRLAGRDHLQRRPTLEARLTLNFSRHCCILGSCVGSAYMGGQP